MLPPDHSRTADLPRWPGRWTLLVSYVVVLLFFVACQIGDSEAAEPQRLPIAIESTSESLLLNKRQLAIADDASLRDVQMIGPNIGYVVGDFGVIRKTEDGGRTWQILPTPVHCRLNAVCFLTDRLGWVAGGTVSSDGGQTHGCLLQTVDGGQTWRIMPTPGIGMIHDLQFFDLKQAFVCGEATSAGTGGVWKTEDGGNSWQAIATSEFESWRCGAFVSIDGGVVGGLSGRVGLVDGSRLLGDRGLNLGAKGVRAITLDQRASGWLVGDGGLVRYAPAGAAWQDPQTALPTELKTLFDFRAVAMLENSVWLVGHPGTAVWYSNDGGSNWKMATTPTTVPLNAIAFGDKQYGIAVGELGTVLRTEDGGQSWHSVGGPPRRLALLQFATTVDEASFCLSARYAGHYGYRTGVVTLCRQDLAGSDVHSAAEELRLQRGLELTTGQIGTVGWGLPLDVPELALQQTALVSRWNRATDGQLTETVLSQLVRDIRTYRPTVIVIDLPEESNRASQLLRQAVKNAIRSAADPTWLVNQQQFAGITPWQVARLYERSRVGRGGDVILESGEYLPGLKQSVRMAAGPAYQQLPGRFSQVPLTESFELVDLGQPKTPLQLTDLFTGIVLGPGGPARRQMIPNDSPDDTREHAARAALARQQRNYAAYSRTMHDDPQRSGQVIAQLNDVIGNAPSRQAVQQLLELAEEYRQNGQWVYYETLLMQAIETYPAEPLSLTAATELIGFWTSQEMTQFRLQDRNTRVVKRSIDQVQLSSDLQSVLQTAAELPNAASTPVAVPTISAPQQASLTTGSRDDRSSWVDTWQQRALVVYQYLEKQSPDIAQRPQTQLALASLYRQRGATRGSRQVYQQFLNGVASSDPDVDRPLLRHIAESEFWLQARTGIAPQRYVNCYPTPTPPFLDGLLSDECWQQADELRLKSTDSMQSSGTITAGEQPIVMLAYDQEYLYVSGSFPRIAGLPTNLPQAGRRDYDADLRGFDRIQLAFDVNRDYQSSYQFEIDQRGWTSESCWIDPRWNPQWYVAADGEASHWRVELAIPLRELIGGREIQPDEIWAVSLSRILPGLGVQSWGKQQGLSPELSSYGLVHFR